MPDGSPPNPFALTTIRPHKDYSPFLQFALNQTYRPLNCSPSSLFALILDVSPPNLFALTIIRHNTDYSLSSQFSLNQTYRPLNCTLSICFASSVWQLALKAQKSKTNDSFDNVFSATPTDQKIDSLFKNNVIFKFNSNIIKYIS